MMKNRVTRNIGWKLLSLALAFTLWLALAREPEVEMSYSAPIVFRNAPDDLDIATDVPQRIRLELRGPASSLNGNMGDVSVMLNLQNVQPGMRTYTIRNPEINHLPIDVAFRRAVPSQITLQFEHDMSKQVPVVPNVTREQPDGYRIVSRQIEPKIVTIAGPESHVISVDHVSTDPIDLSRCFGPFETRVHAIVGDPEIRLTTPSARVTYKVLVAKARKH